jgi:hypothetical protein
MPTARLFAITKYSDTAASGGTLMGIERASGSISTVVFLLP